jgi:hypothetical protein
MLGWEWVEVAAQWPSSECLLWPWKLRNGYGTYRKQDGSKGTAHREVCRLAHGEAPSPIHQAAHSCDNGACCNPRHLRWATPLENAADRAKGKKYHVGERVQSAKLNEAQAREILASSEQASVLAKRFGVSHRCIRSIRLGVSWPHLKRGAYEPGIGAGILSFGC